MNYYNSLIFISFFKKDFIGCYAEGLSDDLSCFEELSTQVMYIMTIAIFKNILEIGLPWVQKKIKNRNMKKRINLLFKNQVGKTEDECITSEEINTCRKNILRKTVYINILISHISWKKSII